jgi:hypothetical protein
MDTKIEVLINKMKQARSCLDAALEKIAPQSEIYPSWQVKQLLDHITGWDELIIATLHTYRQGESPARSVKSIDLYNAGSISNRKALSVDQSRQAYDVARQEVLKSLQELPIELLTQEFKAPWGGKCTIPGVLKIFISHEEEHARHIENLIAG